MNYLIGLFCFLFIAVFSSQTLVDVCDTLIIGTALYYIIKTQDWVFLKKISKTFWFWGLWLFVILAGYILNSNSIPWVYFLEFRWFLSFGAMIYLLQKIKKTESLIHSLALTSLILNLIALVLYFTRHDLRAGGIYNGIMAFSQNMGIISCFFITYLICAYRYPNELIRNNKLQMILFFSLCITSIILVLLTFTRGIWLSVAVAIAFTSFLILKRFFIYVLISFFVLLTALTTLSPSFKQRLLSQNSDSQTSNQQRKNLWRANLEIVKDYPFLGVGYSLNNQRLTEYYEKLNISNEDFKSHAHNQYIHFASGTGLIGLSFYLFFILYLFRGLLITYSKSQDIKTKSLTMALMSTLVSFCVACLTESSFSISKNRFFFLFFCAFSVSMYDKLKHDTENKSKISA